VSYSKDELVKFIIDLAGTDQVRADSDIFSDLGMGGDDFHEMIEKYATRYSVDMDGYLWYFHADEEGHGFGALFFPPPYHRIERIPVTPAMLTDFANKGKWDIPYPEHTLPKRRYDLLINQILVGLFSIGVVVWLVAKWLA
jgi:hypothetical protein